MTLVAMLKGGWRKYLILFTLVILNLLSGVSLISVLAGNGKYSPTSALLYWVNGFAGQMCLFGMILSFGYEHIDPRRRSLVHVLGAAGCSTVLLSFAAHSNWRMNMMMTKVSRDVDFMLAVANFFLWSILIVSKQRDRQTLLIAGGLGLNVTGGAVAHSLRQIARSLVLTGNVIQALTSILCVWMWWRAFATVPQRAAAPERETTPFPS
jgi:hypothetical protein